MIRASVAVPMVQRSVRHKPLSELKQLDAGSWFAAEFIGATIPTTNRITASL